MKDNEDLSVLNELSGRVADAFNNLGYLDEDMLNLALDKSLARLGQSADGARRSGIFKDSFCYELKLEDSYSADMDDAWLVPMFMDPRAVARDLVWDEARSLEEDIEDGTAESSDENLELANELHSLQSWLMWQDRERIDKEGLAYELMDDRRLTIQKVPCAELLERFYPVYSRDPAL